MQQLADYGTFHDEEQGYIDVDDVFATGTSVSPSDASLHVAPRRSSRFGVWVAVAAVVLTGLLIGVIPLLVNNQETPPADTVVPTSLAESAPTTLGEIVLIPGTWSRVPHDEAVFGGEGIQWMSSVTVGGPGLVAVGGEWSDQSEDAAVWTSPDGLAWSRVPHDEAVFGGEGDQEMISVTAGGPGLVAFGEDSGSGRNYALWTSVDGLSWSRVPQDEAVFAGGGPNDVIAAGPGLVAVGEIESAAAVWTSRDGFNWSRVPHDEAVFGLTLGDGNGMTGVTVGGPGLVAVGSDGLNSDAPTGRAHAVVWTSIDGLTWSRVPHDEAVFGGQGDQGMFDVTVGGPGLVAVGENDHGAPVWTSTDGVVWSQVPHDESVFVKVGLRIFSVAVEGPGLVAVGEDDQGVAVWTSRDGITWVVQRNDLTGGPGSMTVVGGSTLVGVGEHNSDAAVWVWRN